MDSTNDAGRRTDGRTARRDRNRLAVLDAVIELFSEENLSPGVHEVADRSGVSLRSVYRYFEDVDELIAAAIARQFEVFGPLFRIDGLGEGPLETRIGHFAGRRVELFEAVRSVYRAASTRASTDPQVRAGLTLSRQRLGAQSQAMFAPELDALDDACRSPTELLLDTVGQFETLDHLRTHCGLSPDAITDQLRFAVATILRCGGH